MKLRDYKSPALVLSGGGIKAAAFHIGVCLALKEKGFNFAGGNKEDVLTNFPNVPLTFRTYVGSSAGAFISTFLACGFSIESIIEAFTQGVGTTGFMRRGKPREGAYLKPLTYRDIFSLNIKAGSPSRIIQNIFRKKPVISGGIEVLLKHGIKVNGIFTMENMEKYLAENVVDGKTFKSLGVQLYIVTTQLNHSRKVIFSNYEKTYKDEHIKYAGFAQIPEAVAASASLPPVFAPYGIKNEKGKTLHFFDGEIRDTLSSHVAADHNCDLIVCSNSIQPYHYNKEMGSLADYGIPLIINQALYQVVQQKISSHINHQKKIGQMINSVDGYLKQIDIDKEHREKLLDILITKTNYKPNVEYIYIHPSPHDYKMFFYDHFSLNPKILNNIVKAGFKTAMSSLRQYNV